MYAYVYVYEYVGAGRELSQAARGGDEQKVITCMLYICMYVRTYVCMY